MTVVARSIKYIFIFLALLLLALLAFVATFDANHYKPQIIEQVEKATGRSFVIDGDINLSIFPWIGLKVEDVALGNAKGFNAEHFAAIEQLDIKVNVLPLLKKEVEVNTIRLHGLDVFLEVAKNKSNNWSGLTQEKSKTESTAKTAEPQSEETAAGLPLQALKIEGFEFVDAIIRYHDRSTDTLATVSELNLTTSAITFDEPIEVNFGARIENNKPQIDTRLTLRTLLRFNQALNQFNLSEFVFTILADANEFIPQAEKIELTADIDISMEAQRIVLKPLQLSALGTTTVAEITVTQFLQTPVIKATIEVQAFNAREVAKRVAVELPAMAKADALQRVSLATKIQLQGEKFQANDFTLKLDDSTLSGWLHMLNISKQQLRYDLAFDRLNLNDYLPPVVAEVETEATETAEAATGDEKIELPLEMMRTLDVQGDFRIAELTAKEYDIKQFLLSLTAKNGVIAIKPLSLQMLQGQVVAAVNLNVKKEVPVYNIDLDVSQLQIGPLANPFLAGMMGDKPLKMAGALNLKMAIKTTGETVNQLKKASKGQIVLDMKETSVDGFDPEFYMRSSIAQFLDDSGFGLSKTIMGGYQPREITVFDTIHSTVNLADGIAQTDDFLMDSRRVQVTAVGQVNIMLNTVDVTSSVKLPRGKTAMEKMLGKPVYVRIHGPFTALQYELDKDRLKESTTDVLKNEAKAKLDAKKQQLKAKADAEKQRLKVKADAEKQQLKAKADAEKQRLKEKVDAEKKRAEDKLKEKFKGLF